MVLGVWQVNLILHSDCSESNAYDVNIFLSQLMSFRSFFSHFFRKIFHLEYSDGLGGGFRGLAQKCPGQNGAVGMKLTDLRIQGMKLETKKNVTECIDVTAIRVRAAIWLIMCPDNIIYPALG